MPSCGASWRRAGAAPAGGWRGHSDTETLLECDRPPGGSSRDAARRSSACSPSPCGTAKERTLQPGPRPVRREAALLRLGRHAISSSRRSSRRSARTRASTARSTAARCGCSPRGPTSRRRCRSTSGIFKLEPGCVLTIDAGSGEAPLDAPPPVGQRPGISVRRYWSYRDVDPARARAIRSTTRREALDAARAGAGHRRSRASRSPTCRSARSCRAGSTARRSSRSTRNIPVAPVRTFTIGFEEAGFNEADGRQARSPRISAPSTTSATSPSSEARDVIPLLPAMYDEPFADSSQIPTYLVSRFAREQVTVALTGDGGDELFGGYNRHFTAPQLWQQLQQAAAAAALGDRIAAEPAAVAILERRRRAAAGRAASRISAARSRKALRRRRLGAATSTSSIRASSTNGASRIRRSAAATATGRAGTWIVGDDAPDALRMMYCDAVSYLPDDILCKVDRASMAVSLETRVPFLDHRVAELAARIPLAHEGARRDAASTSFASCSTARRRASCSSGPRPASRSRSANGSRGRCGRGRRICSTRREWPGRAGSIRRSSSAAGDDHLSGRRDSTPAAVGGADVPGVAARAEPAAVGRRLARGLAGRTPRRTRRTRPAGHCPGARPGRNARRSTGGGR